MAACVEDGADAGVAAEHVFFDKELVDVDGGVQEDEFVDLVAEFGGEEQERGGGLVGVGAGGVRT